MTDRDDPALARSGRLVKRCSRGHWWYSGPTCPMCERFFGEERHHGE